MMIRNVSGGLAGGLFVGLLIYVASVTRTSLAEALLAGAFGGIAVGGVVANAWVGYRIAHVWLIMRAGCPVRLLDFLEDARERGVLRQAGPVFQFRHLRLQERLAGG